MPLTSEKTIARLSLYRRLLTGLLAEGTKSVFSHQLAARVGGTAAQVRRDLMALGASGSPTRGYDVRGLIESIGEFLDDPDGQGVALVGAGNLGRALLAHFAHRRPKLRITAAFDTDPRKAGRVIAGCRCHAMDELEEVLAAQGIRVAIIAVPAEAAQPVLDRLQRAGVTGVLNFAPHPLRPAAGTYVEDMDMTTSLEKVAFFARSSPAGGSPAGCDEAPATDALGSRP